MASEAKLREDLKRRIKFGFNQTDLAKELKVSQSHLSEVLSGKKGIGDELAKALGYERIVTYRKK